jgi:hypothetical protein
VTRTPPRRDHQLVALGLCHLRRVYRQDSTHARIVFAGSRQLPMETGRGQRALQAARAKLEIIRFT